MDGKVSGAATIRLLALATKPTLFLLYSSERCSYNKATRTGDKPIFIPTLSSPTLLHFVYYAA
jgi:hypothetical protein